MALEELGRMQAGKTTVMDSKCDQDAESDIETLKQKLLEVREELWKEKTSRAALAQANDKNDAVTAAKMNELKEQVRVSQLTAANANAQLHTLQRKYDILADDLNQTKHLLWLNRAAPSGEVPLTWLETERMVSELIERKVEVANLHEELATEKNSVKTLKRINKEYEHKIQKLEKMLGEAKQTIATHDNLIADV